MEKNDYLMDLFFRVVEVSRKSYEKSYVVNERFDPTGASKMKIYCFMEMGFKKPETELDECGCPNENPKQLLEVKIISIYGHEITVTDFVTGEIVMNCYYSPDNTWNRKTKTYEKTFFIPRKTPNKPNFVLNQIMWNARFLDYEEAKNYKENWDDELFWFLEEGGDPFGCPSDYE